LAWYGKTKPNTTKAHIHQSKQMYYTIKETKQEGQHPLTGQRAANFRLLANQ